MQMEALECGAACLTMVAASSYGFAAKGYRYEPDALRAGGKFPCIIH